MESGGVWSDSYGLNQAEYDKEFQRIPPTPLSHHLRKALTKQLTPCTSISNFWHQIVSFIPVLSWLPSYNVKGHLMRDIIGGLTTGIIHVPQGIAFAVLVGVEPVYGLYASFFPTLFYMFFGTSRHCSLGTYAILALMASVSTSEIMDIHNKQYAETGLKNATKELRPIEIATTLTFTAGIIEVSFFIAFLKSICVLSYCQLKKLIAGIFRLEFMASYFSDQLVSGFAVGSAVHVYLSQVDDIFGITVPKSSGYCYIFRRIYDIIIRIPQTNFYALGLSIFGFLFLYVGKEYLSLLINLCLPVKVPVPYELILMAICTVISHFFDLRDNQNVAVVGLIPAGFPKPNLPRFDIIPYCLTDAVGVAAIAIAIQISMAKMLAKKFNYAIDSGQELYAVGLATTLSSFFNIFPISAAIGRTMVSVESGTKTQLSSIPCCLLLLLVIVWLGPTLQALPLCVLSVVVMMSLRSVFHKFGELPALWRLSKIDFFIWLVAFTSTVFIDVMSGLVISIFFALATIIFRTQWPKWKLLDQLGANGRYFNDSERYQAAVKSRQICIYRFDSAILFNNADCFKTTVRKAVNKWEIDSSIQKYFTEESPNKVGKRYLIMDLSSVAYIDCMGMGALKEIAVEMKNNGYTVLFTNTNTDVLDFLEASHFFSVIPKSCFFLTIRDAVRNVELRWSQLQKTAENTLSTADITNGNYIHINVSPKPSTWSTTEKF